MVVPSETGKVKDGGGGGGGGSGAGGRIRIGSTGKVSALMMQELDTRTSSKKPAIESRRLQAAPVSIHCGVSTKRRQRMAVLNGGSSSSDTHDQIRSQKNNNKKNARNSLQKIPILDSEDLWLDKTPIRGKSRDKKVAKRIVETVDLKCGKHERDWSVPITNQLQRLSFSKISD